MHRLPKDKGIQEISSKVTPATFSLPKINSMPQSNLSVQMALARVQSPNYKRVQPVQFQEDVAFLQNTLGNRKLIQLSQQKQSAQAPTTAAIHEIAAKGVEGSGGKLPYLEKIQAAFGRHNIGHVQAYTGSKAKAANRRIGAEAYATGNKIAFAENNPSLHTVAHEAAHIIQQQNGVQLKGGIGEAGDSYERQADIVADKVVSNLNVENLLGRDRSDCNELAQNLTRIGHNSLCNPDYANVIPSPDAVQSSPRQGIVQTTLKVGLADKELPAVEPEDTVFDSIITGITDLELQKEFAGCCDKQEAEPKEEVSINPLPQEKPAESRDSEEDYLSFDTEDTSKNRETKYKNEKNPLKRVILKWAGAPSAGGDIYAMNDSWQEVRTNKVPRAKARHYEDYDSLARAALAEVRSKPKKEEEKSYAENIMQDEKIRKELIHVIQVRIPKALLTYGKDIRALDRIKCDRRYLKYINNEIKLSEVLLEPENRPIEELVAAIHDVQEVLYRSKDAELRRDTSLKTDEARNEKNIHALPKKLNNGFVFTSGSILDRQPINPGWRGPDSTPKPSDPHVRTALDLGNPTDMGPSMTAARMFVLAQHGEAEPREIESLALALFAFWNRIYRRDLTDIHRYHFTMDMAANFGVPYDPLRPLGPISNKLRKE